MVTISKKMDSCLSWHYSDVTEDYHQSGSRVHLWAALHEQMDEASARNDRNAFATKTILGRQNKGTKNTKISHKRYPFSNVSATAHSREKKHGYLTQL